MHTKFTFYNRQNTIYSLSLIGSFSIYSIAKVVKSMKYISEKEYNAEMLRIKRDNESRARQRKLKAERAKGHPKKFKKNIQ